MAGTLVSFRLNDDDERWLKDKALPDESLNLTAQRLLREMRNSDAEFAPVNGKADTAQIEAVVDTRTEFIMVQVNNKLKEFEDKLGKLLA